MNDLEPDNIPHNIYEREERGREGVGLGGERDDMTRLGWIGLC